MFTGVKSVTREQGLSTRMSKMTSVFTGHVDGPSTSPVNTGSVDRAPMSTGHVGKKQCTSMLEQQRISCAIFMTFAAFWAVSIDGSHLRDYHKEFRSFDGFLAQGCISPNYQRTLAAKKHVGCEHVLKMQKWHGRPLSPCRVWWGWDFACLQLVKKQCFSNGVHVPTGAKNAMFFTWHAFERQGLC